MTRNARRLLQTGQVRRGMELEQVADVLWTYTAPELFELLVTRRGWPIRAYADFIAQSLTRYLVD